MSFQEFCLLLISVCVSVAGQVFLKFGAEKLGKVTFDNALSLVLNMVTIPQLLIGLACYGVGAIAYILLLTRVNLSVAGPSASLIYVFSVLFGYFLFKESIPSYRLFGLGFIICGVVLVAWQKKP
jgi:multidrug transporter EmrE-like cation transporter